MLKITGLVHRYKAGADIAFPDIELAKGESCCVIGPSGKGKSTLLHLISGLLPIKKGEIFIDDEKLSNLTAKETSHIRRNKLSVVLQDVQFINNLTLMENIHLSIPIKDDRNAEYMLELLSDLGITHLVNKYPINFSGGEKQRASLALALAKKPKLLLADEPTANLDDVNAQKVSDLLQSLPQKYQTALLIVSHDYRLKSAFKNIFSI